MELRVLRYFLAVAQEETISGAAELLHISQPTLSRQLIEMEESLGKKLFLRGNRKISLTEEGLFLRKRAQEIINLVEKTELEFQASEQIITGDIYIGTGETDALRLVAKVAQHLQGDYPNIRFHLFSGNGDDVTDRLDKGLIDFGILIEPADLSKYDFLPLPAKDRWGLLMPKDAPLAQKHFIEPNDLLQVPLIISRQTFVDDTLSKWLGASCESLNIIATYNLVFNASLLVEEGMGYALCLDKLINTSGSSNLCFRPLSPILEAGLTIVWKKYQVFSKASEKFLQFLQQDFH